MVEPCSPRPISCESSGNTSLSGAVVTFECTHRPFCDAASIWRSAMMFDTKLPSGEFSTRNGPRSQLCATCAFGDSRTKSPPSVQNSMCRPSQPEKAALSRMCSPCSRTPGASLMSTSFTTTRSCPWRRTSAFAPATSVSSYSPAMRYTVPLAFAACASVFHGFAFVPGFASSPPGDTKKTFSVR